MSAVDIECPAGDEQRELVDLLRRGQQVALDAVGEPLHRLAVGAHAAAAQAAFDPAGKLVRLHRPGHHDVPDARDRLAPLAAVLAAPFAAGDQQRGVAGRLRAVVRDDFGPLLAGLGRRQAQFDQASRREQARRAEAGVERVPVEVPAVGVEHLALREPLRTRLRTHRIGGFQHAQGFGAGDQVGRAQRFRRELCRQAFRREFHLRV